jgi:transcriptional regulator GlxA family with amidase domain
MKFAIFLYPGVEPIDLATFGVLSMARRIAPQIQLLTVAPKPGPVILSNGLTVLAQHGVGDCPPADALIITGGPGWPAQTANRGTLDFIRARAKDSVVMSVCTGGMILAATGLLDGRRATTKREVVSPEEQPLALMQKRYPKVRAVEAQLVDEGRLITAGGVSLCIDATLHLLERMLGAEVAAETARILEYATARNANQRAWAFASRVAPET